MSEPEFDRDDQDAESMFDFLAEDGARSRRKKPNVEPGDKPLPIIRKPVPVSKSGPLLPPRPGAPVPPPPPLTDGAQADEDDFAFLDDGPKQQPIEPAAPNHGRDDRKVTRLQPAVRRQPSRERSADRPPVAAAPSAISSKKAAVDDSDVLSDNPRQVAANQSEQSADASRNRSDRSALDAADSDIDDLFDLTGEFKRPRRVQAPVSRQRRQALPVAEQIETQLDDLDLVLDESLRFDENWQDGIDRTNQADYDVIGRSRGRWLSVALLLIVGGLGSYLVTHPPTWFGFWRGTESAETPAVSRQAPETVPGQAATAAVDPEGDALVEAPVVTRSPLMQRFQEQLARAEDLVARGELEEAEQMLAGMDRAVYGYGVFEFSELENRIDQIQAGNAPLPAIDNQAPQQEAGLAEQAAREEQARLAEQAEREEQARLAEQAAREEQARLAEQAAREEQARLAEQAAREEQARLAEQAAREEQARLAEQAAREEQARLAEQAAREEQARLAEQAAREEQARLAEQAAREEQARQAEQAAREEQARLAEQAAREQARLAEQAAATNTAESQSVNADRLATDRRIAEERAALQRQQAREQRLAEAREREATRAAQALSSTSAPVNEVAAQPNQEVTEQLPVRPSSAVESDTEVAALIRPIGDDDLQQVYRQFVNLQQAIENRDINAVVRLTQRSGARIQQFMQIFENSSEIDARIRNVSTRNATGEIHGTLQINRIRRADGTVVGPPAGLALIALSSTRDDDDGWSAIRW